ncbi:hypothetical protein Pma05_80160 [Plantactinospora mayteni]|uniref:HEAT repeat domain-containing protein n=1 Tax=Plantactinospora mayteni TaxID=566021 RepID=A0ABQ4F3G0_9ACTN|nr:hypothetical protein Pma05_80160 [Plantactinospora mayteni]
MHGDGRVRERAVRATLKRPAGELVPLLVLRTAGWVAPVRDRARAGLAMLLAGDPGGCLRALPTILAGESRTRAGFAGCRREGLVSVPSRRQRGPASCRLACPSCRACSAVM